MYLTKLLFVWTVYVLEPIVRWSWGLKISVNVFPSDCVRTFCLFYLFSGPAIHLNTDFLGNRRIPNEGQGHFSLIRTPSQFFLFFHLPMNYWLELLSCSKSFCPILGHGMLFCRNKFNHFCFSFFSISLLAEWIGLHFSFSSFFQG